MPRIKLFISPISDQRGTKFSIFSIFVFYKKQRSDKVRQVADIIENQIFSRVKFECMIARQITIATKDITPSVNGDWKSPYPGTKAVITAPNEKTKTEGIKNLRYEPTFANSEPYAKITASNIIQHSIQDGFVNFSWQPRFAIRTWYTCINSKSTCIS